MHKIIHRAERANRPSVFVRLLFSLFASSIFILGEKKKSFWFRSFAPFFLYYFIFLFSTTTTMNTTTTQIYLFAISNFHVSILRVIRFNAIFIWLYFWYVYVCIELCVSVCIGYFNSVEYTCQRISIAKISFATSKITHDIPIRWIFIPHAHTRTHHEQHTHTLKHLLNLFAIERFAL